MSSVGPVKETARTFLQLLDAGRYDELSRVLSETVVYRTIGRPPIVGASPLIQYYRDTRTVGIGVHEILDVIADGQRAAVVLRMKARMPDGRVREFGAVDLFRFEEDRIAEIRTFTDVPPAPSELTALRPPPP